MQSVSINQEVIISTIESILDASIKRNEEIIKKLKENNERSGGENVSNGF